MIKSEELKLVNEWDKTFPKSDLTEHCKVTFVNRYGITLAADMYVPKDAKGKLPAIAVSGPFGAVKEQCSGLYAQTMAERGFFDREELKTFRHVGARLQGHPSMHYLPGIDMSSGSLGQGISCAVGMALAA